MSQQYVREDTSESSERVAGNAVRFRSDNSRQEFGNTHDDVTRVSKVVEWVVSIERRDAHHQLAQFADDCFLEGNLIRILFPLQSNGINFWERYDFLDHIQRNGRVLCVSKVSR